MKHEHSFYVCALRDYDEVYTWIQEQCQLCNTRHWSRLPTAWALELIRALDPQRGPAFVDTWHANA